MLTTTTVKTSPRSEDKILISTVSAFTMLCSLLYRCQQIFSQKIYVHEDLEYICYTYQFENRNCFIFFQKMTTAAEKKLNLERATNFMRQYRDPQSRELKKLSANQFMEVWSHYDKDGEHLLRLVG